MERYFEIQEALIASKGVIWDDHNGGSENKLLGVAALVKDGKVVTVGLHKADYFSLNRVYLKEGKVHLSSDSVGGVLFPVNFKDIWECINDYNNKQIDNPFSCGTLENPASIGQPCPVMVMTLSVEEFNAKNHMRALYGITIKDQQKRMERTAAGWTLDGVLLPIPRTKEEVEEFQSLINSGISGTEANQLILDARKRRNEAGPDLLEKVEAGDTKAAGAVLPRIRSLNADYLNPDDEMAQDAYYRRLLANKDNQS